MLATTQMQCVRNWCLHMNTYNLQHYIIFMPTFLNMLYTRSCCIATVQELCVIFQYPPPLYRECLKSSNKVFFFFLYLSSINYLSYEYFELQFLSFSNSYVMCELRYIFRIFDVFLRTYILYLLLEQSEKNSLFLSNCDRSLLYSSEKR